MCCLGVVNERGLWKRELGKLELKERDVVVEIWRWCVVVGFEDLRGGYKFKNVGSYWKLEDRK